MSKVKIVDRVFRLKNNFNLKLDNIKQEFNFKGGQEFHIVADVLYMNGFPIPMELQNVLISWVVNNPSLFIDDNRSW